MGQPRPFDLNKQEELDRLFHEVSGYLRVSLEDGTDRMGRKYAFEAVKKMVSGEGPDLYLKSDVEGFLLDERLSFVVQGLKSIKMIKQIRLESEVVQEIEKVLQEMRIPFNREHVLPDVPTKRGSSRIDLFIPSWGIGIEAKKGKPNTGDVADQMERYSKSEQIKGLILVSERGLQHHIESANGKPIYYISLTTNWGLTV